MTFEQLMDCYFISEEENNRVVYDQLLPLVQSRDVTPFVGAGVSRWAYPLWGEMLREQGEHYGIKREVEELLGRGEYEAAASLLEEEATRNGLQRILQRIFRPALLAENAEKCPAYLGALPRLFGGPIVTTNFDRAVEYLFEKGHMAAPDTVIPSDDFQSDKLKRALHENAPVLVKMHGDIEDPEHLVLTEEAYNGVYGGDPARPDMDLPMPKFLGEILGRNPVLFLGCSLGADRTCAVIKGCSRNHRQFALLPLPKETRNSADQFRPILRGPDGRLVKALQERRKALVGSMNVSVIWYPQGMHEEALAAFFARLEEDVCPHSPAPTGGDVRYAPLHRLLGREEDVRRIAAALTEGEPRCVWVDGPAGIGKTEICKAVYALLRRKHPTLRMPYVDITGVSSLSAFFDAVTVGAEVPVSNQIGIADVPARLLEKLEERYPAGAEDNAPRLLYFDNWEDVWYGLRDPEERARLVQWMRALCLRGFRILVSSREAIPPALGSCCFHAGPLDGGCPGADSLPEAQFAALDSVRLFQGILSREIAPSEQEAFRGLIRQLEGHPLAIVLTATQARREVSLRDLLSRWESAGQDGAGVHKTHTSLEIALRMSWEAVRGSREAVIQWGLEYYSLRAIPNDVFRELRGDDPEDNWREGLGMLLNANLVYVTRDREGVAMLLPLKKQFCRLVEPGDSVHEVCLSRWAGYIRGLLDSACKYGAENRLAVHHRVLELLPQIFHIMEQLMQYDSIQARRDLDNIVRRVRHYYQFHIQSAELVERLAGYYRQRQAADILPRILEDYGDLLRHLGDVDGAKSAYDEAEELYRGERDNLGLANVLQSRGNLLRRLGDADGAATAYDEAEGLYRGERDNLGLASVLQSRGDLLSRLGNVDGAKAAYDGAERLYRGGRDNLGLANVRQSRGDLLSRLGDVDGAMTAYDEAEGLYRGERDNLGLANVLQSRGDLLRRLGDADGAATAYDEAEGLYRGERNNLGLANVLQSRGDLLSRLGDADGAKSAYDEAEGLYRGERDNLGLANVLKSRGDLLRRLGDADGAATAYDEAEGLYRGQRDNLGLANVLQSQGDLLHRLGDADGAKSAYDRAEPLFREERNKLGLANLLQSRGDLLREEGLIPQAYQIYKEAEALYCEVRDGVGRIYTLAEIYDCCRQLSKRREAEKVKREILSIIDSIPYERVKRYVYSKFKKS